MFIRNKGLPKKGMSKETVGLFVGLFIGFFFFE